ncbi:MAG TPA: DUF2117 domain-containing protein, partial [Candidatus Methanoperedens sp.]
SGNPLPLYVRNEGDMIIRRISGVFPGETIRLDGTVIGTATQEEPEIICKDGLVIGLRGGNIKPHGLEKLKNRKIDLFKAKIKTGGIRRTKCRARTKIMRSGPSKTAAIIDHCAESTFELIKGADIVITVGDDTTAIAADVLARFGIPVIGITDGDLDGVLEDPVVSEGSVIIRVMEGLDDIIGHEVSEKLMEGELKIHVNGSDKLLEGIISLAEKYIISTKYY